MLKLNHISKSFGGIKVIDDLSFKAQVGQIIGLLGPNGAGKTTTMRLITSYFFPDLGQIEIDGVRTNQRTLESQGKIGYLPENNPLYPEMLVVDFLRLTLDLSDNQELQKLSEEGKLKLICKQARAVNLESKLMSQIGQLSKGYKQRVGLAAALIHQPKVVVLDEPTEGLDPNEREQIRSLIKTLAKERVIVISTHVLSEVKALCNYALVMNEGKVVVEGDPNHLTGKFRFELEIEGTGVVTKLNKLLDIKGGDTLEIVDKSSKIKVVTIGATKDIRPRLTKLASREKWQIWSMKMGDELDQVFRDLK
jgi:ABC-2 type transport system ATP-binding protein